MTTTSDERTAEASDAASRGRPGRRATRRPPSVLAMIFMIVVAAYFLIPLFWLLVASSKSQGDLIGTFGLWFSKVHWATNLKLLFHNDGGVFTRWLLNSALYAIVGSLVSTLLAAMAGYGLAKFVFRGREATFSLILGGVLVPATALALPLFLLFSKVHLTNTYWSVLLPSFVSPFGVYLSRVYASGSVPDEMIEAARIDGAGEYRIFFSHALRLMSPALVTIFLFQFVATWNNFFLPLVMLSSEKLYPVTLGLYTWNSQADRAANMQLITVVGSLVSILPLIAIFLLLQRYWRVGLGAGGIK